MSVFGHFRDEAARLGTKIPVEMQGAPTSLAAVLLSGVAAYDVARGLAKHEYLGREHISGEAGKDMVDAKKYAARFLKAHAPDKPVLVVTTMDDVKEMLKDRALNPLTRILVMSAARRVIEKATNAFALKGKERYYVVLPPKVSARVVEHEVGHLLDKAPSPGFFASALSTFLRPSYDRTVMSREKKAWEAAKPTELKARALGTYDAGFHRRRADMAASIGTMLAATAGGT